MNLWKISWKSSIYFRKVTTKRFLIIKLMTCRNNNNGTDNDSLWWLKIDYNTSNGTSLYSLLCPSNPHILVAVAFSWLLKFSCSDRRGKKAIKRVRSVLFCAVPPVNQSWCSLLGINGIIRLTFFTLEKHFDFWKFEFYVNRQVSVYTWYKPTVSIRVLKKDSYKCRNIT